MDKAIYPIPTHCSTSSLPLPLMSQFLSCFMKILLGHSKEHKVNAFVGRKILDYIYVVFSK